MSLDSTLKRHDSLMPQPLGGLRKGTALALVVHVGLIVALAFGVAWRIQTPAGVSAELWAAVPQVAAPAPVETPKPAPTPAPPTPAKAEQPPPQVNEAQIAIEKEKAERKLREQQEREREERARKERERRQRELEQEKAEQVAAQKRREAEQARQQKEAEARQAKLRQENLKRMMGQAGSGGQSPGGTAPRDAGPSASYAGRIIARVKPNIVLTDDIPGNPVAVVEVRCAPDGMIIGKRLVQGSGNKTWDDAVLRAIDRTEQLPRDTDGRVPSSIVIEFRPRD